MEYRGGQRSLTWWLFSGRLVDAFFLIVVQRAIDLHYSGGLAQRTTAQQPRRTPSDDILDTRPRSVRRQSSSSYPPSSPPTPSLRHQSTPLVARLGLGTIYGLFWPIRFALRILLGFWFILGESRSLDAVHCDIRTDIMYLILQPRPSFQIRCFQCFLAYFFLLPHMLGYPRHHPPNHLYNLSGRITPRPPSTLIRFLIFTEAVTNLFFE